jgi:hypothetical protein
VEACGIGSEDMEALTRPRDKERNAVVLSFEHSVGRSYALAQGLLTVVGSFDVCLLWVTEFGVWPSMENRHLYYRLRESYQNRDSLAEAPGHLFGRYEISDAVSFLDVTLRCGWGGYLVSNGGGCLFFSHDSWLGMPAALSASEEIEKLMDADLLRYLE